VLNSLFDLSLKVGELDRALDVVEESRKRGLIDRDTARRRRAVILTDQARRAQAEGRAEAARDSSKEAIELAPDLVPAARVRAEVLLAEDRGRAAAKVIEKVWESQPHPELVDPYLRARGARTDSDRYSRLRRLADRNPGHRESELALGRAALAAEQWKEARRHLQRAGGDQPSEEVCRAFAELEERGADDPEAARGWLRRAAEAPADPAWVCTACGAVARSWSALCGHCGGFDTFVWQAPPRPGAEAAADETVARLETAGANGGGQVQTAEAAAVEAQAGPAQPGARPAT
jgi:HemY protein